MNPTRQTRDTWPPARVPKEPARAIWLLNTLPDFQYALNFTRIDNARSRDRAKKLDSCSRGIVANSPPLGQN